MNNPKSESKEEKDMNEKVQLIKRLEQGKGERVQLRKAWKLPLTSSKRLPKMILKGT